MSLASITTINGWEIDSITPPEHIISDNWDELQDIVNSISNNNLWCKFNELYQMWKQYYDDSNVEEDYKKLYEAKRLIHRFCVENRISSVYVADRYCVVDIDFYVEENWKIIGRKDEFPSMPETTKVKKITVLVRNAVWNHLRAV